MSQAVFCPNCDGIISIGRCQACGWKPGENVVRNEAINPYHMGRIYANKLDEASSLKRWSVRPVPVEEPPEESAPVAADPTDPNNPPDDPPGGGDAPSLATVKSASEKVQ